MTEMQLPLQCMNTSRWRLIFKKLSYDYAIAKKQREILLRYIRQFCTMVVSDSTISVKLFGSLKQDAFSKDLLANKSSLKTGEGLIHKHPHSHIFTHHIVICKLSGALFTYHPLLFQRLWNSIPSDEMVSNQVKRSTEWAF